LEGCRGEEWIVEAPSLTKWEIVVERTWVTEKRLKEFKGVGESEDIGVERVTPGGVVWIVWVMVMAYIFVRRWPDTVAVVR
jgi:hypothetical protein